MTPSSLFYTFPRSKSPRHFGPLERLRQTIGVRLKVNHLRPALGGRRAHVESSSLPVIVNHAACQQELLTSFLYRLLSHTIQTHLIDPSLLPTILRNLRSALFPNNAPGPATLVPPANEAELLAIRRDCAMALLALIPRPLASLYFAGQHTGPLARILAGRPGPATATESDTPFGEAPGAELNRAGNRQDDGDENDTDEMVLRQLEGVLDVFGDAYCNKHLLYRALELVLVRLLPEIAEQGVSALLAERLH